MTVCLFSVWIAAHLNKMKLNNLSLIIKAEKFFRSYQSEFELNSNFQIKHRNAKLVEINTKMRLNPTNWAEN